jgi:toxin ParE1/3/4
MIVEWRPDALAALIDIFDYIDERNPQAAVALLEDIEATSALPEHPYLYRFGRVPTTREIVVHPNYIVVYRVKDKIEVVNVLHSRRQYP